MMGGGGSACPSCRASRVAFNGQHTECGATRSCASWGGAVDNLLYSGLRLCREGRLARTLARPQNAWLWMALFVVLSYRAQVPGAAPPHHDADACSARAAVPRCMFNLRVRLGCGWVCQHMPRKPASMKSCNLEVAIPESLWARFKTLTEVLTHGNCRGPCQYF